MSSSSSLIDSLLSGESYQSVGSVICYGQKIRLEVNPLLFPKKVAVNILNDFLTHDLLHPSAILILTRD